MIIDCQNCSKKFLVKDTDIPEEGRMVQCGYCSQKWFQEPTRTQDSITSDIDKNVSEMEFEASDGKTYRFLGSQWAVLLRSGKTGLLAKKKISIELNKLAGITDPQGNRKGMKKSEEIEITSISKVIDPSSEQIDGETKQKKGMGFFTYIFLLIVITLCIVGILKTFQSELLTYFPESEYIYNKGEYIFESIDNMIIIIKDFIRMIKGLIKSY